jgi:hypothetical protein
MDVVLPPAASRVPAPAGVSPQPLPPMVREYLAKLGMRAEVLDSRNATGAPRRASLAPHGQPSAVRAMEGAARPVASRRGAPPLRPRPTAAGLFNILNDEGRSVVGALLACDPDARMPENLPDAQEPLWDRPFIQQRSGLV